MNRKNRLTKNQYLVFSIISSSVKKKGFSPTFSELQKSLAISGLNLKSVNSVSQYLNALEERGYIKKSNQKRGIKILKTIPDEFVEVPLLGTADCGEPLSFADDYIEDHISISSKYLDETDSFDYFFIRASGDSMNKERINDGDYVLVKRFRGEPENNENVLASINGMGVIKKFKKQKDTAILSPSSSNRKHSPIVLHPEDKINICGKVQRVFNFSK